MPDPPFPIFPPLPIVSLDPTPRRSAADKYGALFYLGVGGLAVVVALLAWFGWQAWSLRTVWMNVFVVHDTSRDETTRLNAAHALAHDPRVNSRQLWDIALERDLLPRARYFAAEGLRPDAVEADPRGYAVSVARSEGWPDWLRLLLFRPLAYAAASGLHVDRASLDELTRRDDPVLSLWARFATAVGPDGDAESARILREAASEQGPTRPTAQALVGALDARGPAERIRALDAAKARVRLDHPPSIALWDGWEVRPGGVAPTAPKLH